MDPPELSQSQDASAWDEQSSQEFIQHGKYFVPERETQVEVIATLLSHNAGPGWVIDLGCGEGWLSQSILEKIPSVQVLALDGSPAMLEQAQARLARFGGRFAAQQFDLLNRKWPSLPEPVQALVSSLAVHHLDGPQKQALFWEVFALLAPGGRCVIADIVAPADPVGWELAAEAWDEAVRRRSLDLDGSLAGFDRFQQLRWNTYRYFDPQDIDRPSSLLEQLKWLEQSGFSSVDVFWMRAGHAIFGGLKPGGRGSP